MKKYNLAFQYEFQKIFDVFFLTLMILNYDSTLILKPKNV